MIPDLPEKDFWGDQNDFYFVDFVCLSFKPNKAQKPKPQNFFFKN